MAQRLFGKPCPADRKLVRGHIETALGYVDLLCTLYWEIGEWHLLKHATRPRAFQVSFRPVASGIGLFSRCTKTGSSASASVIGIRQSPSPGLSNQC